MTLVTTLEKIDFFCGQDSRTAMAALYLCSVNLRDEICAPTREIFSPTGEIKKTHKRVQMAVGFDKEDGGGS